MGREIDKNNFRFWITGSELLVIMFWCVQMGAKGFAISISNPIYCVVSYCLIPLAVLKIVFFHYNVRDIIISLVISILSIGIMATTSDSRMLIVALCIIACKDIEIEKIMKYTFYVRGTAYLIRILLTFAGLLEPQINALGEYGFGFGHSNLAHGEFFCVVSSFILWKQRKVRIYQLVMLNAVNIVLFLFTKSKTPFILIILLSLMVMMRNIRHHKRFLKFVVPKAFLAFTAISLFLSLFYYQLPFKSHSTFLARFQTAYYMFRIYDINLFGNDVNFLNDLGYVDILFTCGLPWTIFFVLGHTGLGIWFAKRSNWVVLSYLLVISIYFTMEAYAESVLYNYCWLYYVVLLYHKDSMLERIQIRFTREAL